MRAGFRIVGIRGSARLSRLDPGGFLARHCAPIPRLYGTAQGITIQFGARTLFSDLSFTLVPKDRVAFAGPNGAGKSTLMKIIAGIATPDAGKIVKSKATDVGYLPQEGVHAAGARSTPRQRPPLRRCPQAAGRQPKNAVSSSKRSIQARTNTPLRWRVRRAAAPPARAPRCVADA
ncbi:MAG: ATP-binding cassette domain-containing protein [Verrucomicrobiales bacterium]